MGNFRAAFEAYGADYDGTMRRFLGNEAMYLRVLGMLPRDGSVNRLGDALESGGLGGAFEAAHSLKGVAGNLGLDPLYKAACAVVEPLRLREERNDYPELYRAVRKEFERAGLFLEALKGEPT